MTRPYTPSILIAHEKHGDYLYDATTPSALDESAFAILKHRFEEGYWYLTPDEVYNDEYQYEKNILSKIVPGWAEAYYVEGDKEKATQLIADYKEQNISVIPDAEAQNLVQTKLSKAIARERKKIAYAKWYSELERVIREEDKEAAWGILRDRSDYEYEHVELERLRKAGE